MNRPLLIAAFAVLGFSFPLYAQHGGGHASTGGHSGFASHGSFSGHSGGGQSFRGSSSGLSSRSASSYRSFSGPLSSSRNYGRSGARIRSYGYGRNCYGYGCRGGYGYGYGYGYPWLYWGLDPYWWGDSGSSYDQSQQDEIGLANEMNAQSLDEQRMREQSNQDLYAAAAPPRPRQKDHSAVVPDTVLVFRDQHKQEVQNYAIVGQTLWIFSPQRTQKVALSDLDIDATQKANGDRGVDFRMPVANAGQ